MLLLQQRCQAIKAKRLMPSFLSEFSIGLVVNPIAGLGGAVGLKGSDDPRIQEMALQKGASRNQASV